MKMRPFQSDGFRRFRVCSARSLSLLRGPRQASPSRGTDPHPSVLALVTAALIRETSRVVQEQNVSLSRTTERDMPNEHRQAELPWKVESLPEYGDVAAKTIPYEAVPPNDPEDLIFRGPCPRCPHEFTYKWPLVVVRGVTAASASETPVIVRCQCGATHPGRPEKQSGCGAFWKVRVGR